MQKFIISLLILIGTSNASHLIADEKKETAKEPDATVKRVGDELDRSAKKLDKMVDEPRKKIRKIFQKEDASKAPSTEKK